MTLFLIANVLAYLNIFYIALESNYIVMKSNKIFVPFLLIFFILTSCDDSESEVSQFFTINIENTDVINEQGKVKVRFKITDDEDIGVAGKSNEDFNLYESVQFEQEQLIDPLEAPRLIVPSPESFGYGTMIIMDLSGSVINEIEDIKSASIDYVNNLFENINSGSLSVGVYFFDGRSELQEVSSFSNIREDIVSAIVSMNETLQVDDDTALYHAVVQGCNLINEKRNEFMADPNIRIFSTSIVVFSDGNNSNFTGVNGQQMNSAISQSTNQGTDFYSIGSGLNVNNQIVEQIGQNGVFLINNYSQLNQALNDVLEIIIREANSNYELEICSAKSGINVNYRLELKNTTTIGGLGSYNSQNFPESANCSIN